MSIKSLAFSVSSLDLCCRQSLTEEWFTTFDVPADGSWGVLKYEYNDVIYILDASANLAQTKIIVDLNETGFFDRFNPNGLNHAIQRMYYMAKSIKHPRAWFPETWGQYVATNIVSVYAYPMGMGRERIVANMIRPEGNVFFCIATSKEHPVVIENYEPNLSSYALALFYYKDAAKYIREQLKKLDKPTKEGVFNLSEIAYGGVSLGLTYSTWLPRLSDDQKNFVNVQPESSQKLRGPAGTGKTLAMAIKALHELYRSEDLESPLRILYITHSWGVAEQVQNILDQLDERSIASKIDVLPLLTLAQLHLDNSSIRVLGDDSHEGKEKQLQALSSMVEKAKKGDWNVYEASCSSAFAERISAQSGTPEANRLLWDLMLEFSCVIGANGIMPSFGSEQKYKQIERRPWMMPLENDTDKEFVYNLYASFVSDLIGREEMTTDQAINDFLNKLATFRWYAQRVKDGYDLIFVDEFHLFNEQERMVFHNMTRNPDQAPVIFMAMDPRQSPSETYAEFVVPDMSLKGAVESERTLGKVSNINLKVVYRYTPQILSFIQLIDKYFPNLQLGADWEISITDAKTERENGQVPQIHFLSNESLEIESAVTKAISLSGEGQSVALLCLDSQSFIAYKEYVSDKNISRFGFIESRDDVGSLRFQKKTIMLSQPHYVAGLQFDAVVIGGFRTDFRQYNPNQSYSLRRFLSDFYLGASRARNVLQLFSSDNQADLPAMLGAAVEAGLLEVAK